MPLQASFDQLGTPLTEVSFCVVDLETTGGSAAEHGITEIGAVKVRRGEVIGTFHTLVDPGQPVPAFIRLLTGITDDMLIESPRIEAVLPSLLEFISGTVLVAHNARFDVGFLNAALGRSDYPKLTNSVLDTAILARKILAGEVPNHKLSTLASFLRTPHKPEHRAYADALATIDVLHHLIERVAGYGVTTLEDLVAMTSTRMDGTFSKIKMTEGLPRGLGVYRFIGADEKILYVGKASDVRSRVRSYFYGDPRRKIRDLLRETHSIEAEVFPTLLEAEIAEARAIAAELPPYNRSGKRRRSWYLRVEPRRGKARLATARIPKDDGSIYLGPLPSMRVARVLLDAFRDAARIHRCTDPKRCTSCPFGDLGTCAGADAAEQRAELQVVAAALAGHPRAALEAIARRMDRLARNERFEEAAEVRDRGALLERSLATGFGAAALQGAGDVILAVGTRALLIRDARLVARANFAPGAERVVCRKLLDAAPEVSLRGFVSEAQQREAAIIYSWLRRAPESTRLLHATRPWALPASAGPSGLFVTKEKESAGDAAHARDAV
jgi:DNA polymerase-3 subunit epsilon